MDAILRALTTAAGMLYKAFWALVFGYAVSAAIQVLVTRQQMGRVLGERGLRQVGLAAFFGFVSSSCSFAALAASRSVFVKGAHPANALAFLIASTNLVIELGIVLWVLVGWKFMLANLLLGVLMVLYAYAITRLISPRRLAESARQRAEESLGEAQQRSDAERSSLAQLASLDGWRRIARAFVMEWHMVYKELLFGFTVAGFISVLVPRSFWQAIFLRGGDAPPLLVVLENALVAPVVAFFTFIGSMGNVPLAAMLWAKGASFGGVMTFLGADLVAATVVWVHAKYYGVRYALFLSAVLYVCMTLAGISVHYAYAALGALPSARPAVAEMVHFEIDYTFWLNLTFAALGAFLLSLHFSDRRRRGQHAAAV
ncbi:MAG TPA: permease [Polyangiaceae bacterium]|nr:permease [Polyangiaceae bacterium]